MQMYSTSPTPVGDCIHGGHAALTLSVVVAAFVGDVLPEWIDVHTDYECT